MESSSSSSSSSPSTSPRESNAEQKTVVHEVKSVEGETKKTEIDIDVEKLLIALQNDKAPEVKSIVEHIKKPLQPHGITDLQKYASVLLRNEYIASNLHSRFQKSVCGEIEEVIYEWMFEWYQTDIRELQLFVVRFIPVITAMYLVHSSKRKIVPGKSFFSLDDDTEIESLLLCIYHNEFRSRNDQPLTWRPPSAKDQNKFSSSSSTSIQNQPKDRRKTVSTVGSLNESNLKKLDPQGNPIKEPVVYEHPIAVIQAENLKKEDRDSIVTIALKRFVYFIDSMPNPALKAFCFVCARLTLCGFQSPLTLERRVSVMSLPKGATDSPREGKKEVEDGKKATEFRPLDELEKLKSKDSHELDIHLSEARIPLCVDILQAFVTGITFAIHKSHVENFARAALQALNFRANRELLPEVMLTVNSLIHISSKDNIEKHLPWRL